MDGLLKLVRSVEVNNAYRRVAKTTLYIVWTLTSFWFLVRDINFSYQSKIVSLNAGWEGCAYGWFLEAGLITLSYCSLHWTA